MHRHFFATCLLLISFGKIIAKNADSLELRKSLFYSAKVKIEDMLDGKAPLSYEKAVFIMENAYLENKVEYNTFKKIIDYELGDIKKIMEHESRSLRAYNPNVFERAMQTPEARGTAVRNLIANHAIYAYLKDTFIRVLPTNEGKIEIQYPNPYTYSYKDPFGTKNWGNTQVMHLLTNGNGNCFALASLFRIFAERLNTDASLCTAPGHIFITHADEKGISYNIELSNGLFPGMGTMSTLTYSTNDAIRNGIALRNLDLRQSVSLCLVYLAKGYEFKFGVVDDSFVLSCAEAALKYDDHSLNAMLLKAEILERRIVAQHRSVQQLQANINFKEYEKVLSTLCQLGYREMPLEMKNLLIKSWTKDKEAALVISDHTPQKFNHSGVPNTRYASLSWGVFDEEIITKPIERFGKTLYNTKTRKIVSFDNGQTLYNDYNFDPVVFALNVDPLSHKFPWQSPYAAFNSNPILYNDPTGQSGEVSINKEAHTITVTANMVFYGNKANSTLAVTTAKNVQDQWNAAKGTVVVDDVLYNVQFQITGQYRPDLTKSEVEANKDIKNNYIRVDDNTPAGGSLTYDPDGKGSNSGWYKYDEISGDDETTASHEMGHGWGIQTDDMVTHHNDYNGGTPDIMIGRGVDASGVYSNQSGQLNPCKRIVTPENILSLGIQNLEFVNNKAQLGALLNKFYNPLPTTPAKPTPVKPTTDEQK